MDVDLLSRGYYNRYPVRFIIINDFQYLKTFLNNCCSKDIAIKKITDELNVFKRNEDAWINVSDILNFVKSINDKKSVIIPISEIVRFYSDNEFYSIFQSLLEIENTNKDNQRRIYIPLVGIKERFESIFFNKYIRRTEWDPLWELQSEKTKYCIYLTNLEINKQVYRNIEVIHNSYEFINLYEKEFIDKNIIVTSRTINFVYNNNLDYGIYQVQKINSIKDFIKYICNIEISVDYKEYEKDYWQGLLKELNKYNLKYFNEFIKEYFNVKKLDNETILDLISDLKNKNNKQEFKIWLLKLYILQNQEYDNTYLKSIFINLKEYDYYTFTKLYLTSIFENKNLEKFITERLKGLKILLSGGTPATFDDILRKKLKDIPIEKVTKFLTGLLNCEKEWIIENYSNTIDLENIYPELKYYVSDEIFKEKYLNEQIYSYIKEYKHSKINNKVVNKVEVLINKLSNDSKAFYNWFYNYKNINSFINKESIDEIIQIDGLGVEFASLLINLLQKENENYIFSLEIARAELPSITEINKIDGATLIRDLDQFIHKEFNYSYPKTLIHEIEIIKSIAYKISEKLKLEKKNCIITGDHGFSIFVIQHFLGKNNRYNFDNAAHGGRYVELNSDENYSDCEDYVVYQNQQKRYLVPIKHISLGQRQRGESHGGATPEEVLVPVIIAKYGKSEESKVYQIDILNNIIDIRNPKIIFTVVPNPQEKPLIIVGNQNYSTEYDKDNSCYYCILLQIKKGRKPISISIGSFKQQFEIEVKGGMEEIDLL